MTNTKERERIEKRVNEIFEPIEDDQCKDCEVNFYATKIIMTEAICEERHKALAEERERVVGVIEKIIDVNDDGLWGCRESFDDLITSLDITNNQTNI